MHSDLVQNYFVQGEYKLWDGTVLSQKKQARKCISKFCFMNGHISGIFGAVNFREVNPKILF